MKKKEKTDDQEDVVRLCFYDQRGMINKVIKLNIRVELIKRKKYGKGAKEWGKKEHQFHCF